MLAEALLALERYAEAEPHLRRLARDGAGRPRGVVQPGQGVRGAGRARFEELLERAPGVALRPGPGRRRPARSRTSTPPPSISIARPLERRPAFRGLHAAVAGSTARAGHADWAARRGGEGAAAAAAGLRTRTRSSARSPPGGTATWPPAASSRRRRRRTTGCARAYNELADGAFGRLTALPPSPQSHERHGAWSTATSGDIAESVGASGGRRSRSRPATRGCRWSSRSPCAWTATSPRAQQVLEDAAARGRRTRPSPTTCSATCCWPRSSRSGRSRSSRRRCGWSPERAARARRARPRLRAGGPCRGRDPAPRSRRCPPTRTAASVTSSRAPTRPPGQAEQAQAALKDYEEFRKALGRPRERGPRRRDHAALMGPAARGALWRRPSHGPGGVPPPAAILLHGRRPGSGLDFVHENSPTPAQAPDRDHARRGGRASTTTATAGSTSSSPTAPPCPASRRTPPEYANRLFRNQGGMRFADVTEARGPARRGLRHGRGRRPTTTTTATRTSSSAACIARSCTATRAAASRT